MALNAQKGRRNSNCLCGFRGLLRCLRVLRLLVVGTFPIGIRASWEESRFLDSASAPRGLRSE
jgi:hypothetical protein